MWVDLYLSVGMLAVVVLIWKFTEAIENHATPEEYFMYPTNYRREYPKKYLPAIVPPPPPIELKEAAIALADEQAADLDWWKKYAEDTEETTDAKVGECFDLLKEESK